MGKLTRRIFLKYTGSGAAVGTLALSNTAFAQQSAPSFPPGSTTLPYPQQPIAKLNELQVNNPVSFSYPDSASPCVLIKKVKPFRAASGRIKTLLRTARYAPTWVALCFTIKQQRRLSALAITPYLIQTKAGKW